ncbi:MAG: pyridoxamine 5'-phosphate oxidase [Chloroflexi bacterium]|nr:MAG: pyridoxamine 5'-phosphate oxidase [Chloroflexota bacterium]
MSLAMTREEREVFLADLHVGVVSVPGEDGRAPLAVPIWYRYEPGGLLSFFTGGESRKARALRETGRCTVCVQDEAPPYKYTTVEGPVVAIDPVDEEERRQMAARYLGAETADAYIAATAEQARQEVTVRMRPEHWLSADYSKLGG